MKYRINEIGKSKLLAACLLMGSLLLAGCDDHITVIRDRDIPVMKGNTWAWKPIAPPRDADRRPVVSRDVISRGETIAREPGANSDIVKQSSKRLAYRAIGQKPVDRDTFNQDEISEFVHHMLGKLKTNG